MAKDKTPKAPKAPKEPGAFKKLLSAYRITRKHDKYVLLVVLAAALVAGLLMGALFWWLIHPLAGIVVGIPSAVLAGLVVFGRRAEKAAYAQVEGQPGAAAAALGILRRGWQVQTAIAVTRNQDLVHRVVGRPGVVLVGEGNPARVRHLIGVEKKKHARVVGDTPIYDIVVGEVGEADTTPVNKVAKQVMKLPRNITAADVTDLLQRLKALDAMRPQIPVPKGPMPQNMRQARQSSRPR